MNQQETQTLINELLDFVRMVAGRNVPLFPGNPSSVYIPMSDDYTQEAKRLLGRLPKDGKPYCGLKFK